MNIDFDSEVLIMTREVFIGGIKYVPLQEVVFTADIFIDKLIDSCMGRGWEKRYNRKELMDELRISVSDTLTTDYDTLTEFYNTLVS